MVSFKGWHFEKCLMLMVVRWYIAYALSYRDIEELMCERGASVDHSTLNRQVIHNAPRLEEKFQKNYKQPVGRIWHMDETYIKVKGVWHCLYRAVYKNGETIGFMLSENEISLQLKPFF